MGVVIIQIYTRENTYYPANKTKLQEEGEEKMNSKLSASKFIRNNKKQVWVLIIALALSFMTMYIINFLFMASEVRFRPVCLEQPKKVAFISVNYDTFGISIDDYETLEEAAEVSKARKEKFMEDLRNYPGITDAYETQVLNSTYNGIAGGIGYMLGSTGGYIVGFIFTALTMWLMESLFGKKRWVLTFSMLLGILVCYVFGTVW